METTRYKSIKGFIFCAHLFLWSGNKRIETDVVSAGKGNIKINWKHKKANVSCLDLLAVLENTSL